MKKGLVSIIIPTYNRSHLIGETLDSVIAQTYQHWECIVVDDGSRDYTKELLEFYCEKDDRIKYYQRPSNQPKGANACRNYGFEMSHGEFINWFDSDDLMFKNALEEKISGFDRKVDFVIGNSLNFKIGNDYERPFPLNNLPINAENFVGNKINWITNDVMMRRSSIKIRFDEELSSGQEYNFFSRFLCYNDKGKYLHKDLTKRRIHDNSIQSQLQQNELIKISELLFNEKRLLVEIQNSVDVTVINRSLRRIIRFTYQLSSPFKVGKNEIQLLLIVWRLRNIEVFALNFLWISTNLIFGKGYFFLKKSFKLLE